MNDGRILPAINPPAGGWQRLVARRDAPWQVASLFPPLATAMTLLLVISLLWPTTHRIALPSAGDRLVARAAEGVAFKPVQGNVAVLPSSDPSVQFFWTEPKNTPPASPTRSP